MKKSNSLNDGYSFFDKVVEHLYRYLSAALLGSFVTIPVLCYFFWNKIPPVIVLSWGGANLAVLIPRIILLFAFKKKTGKTNADYRFYYILFLISLILVGMALGSSTFFLYIPGELSYQIFTYLMLGGMVAGIVGTYSINSLCFWGYALPVFLPYTIRFLLTDSPISFTTGLMGVFFLLVMFVTSRRVKTTYIQNLIYIHKNKELLDEVTKEKNKITALNRELKELVLIDPLTGLKNRRFLKNVLVDEMKQFVITQAMRLSGKNMRSDPANSHHGIFILDIDFFKNINDTYGHASGDTVLTKISEILNNMIRKTDIAIRWGGEEFLIILRTTIKEYIAVFAEKLLKAISETSIKISDEKCITVSVSIGFLPFPVIDVKPELISFHDALRIADIALYHAKETGRNRAITVSINENTFSSLKQGHGKNIDFLSAREKYFTFKKI